MADRRNSYSSTVKIGNWLEETLQDEEDLKMFLRKRDRGELLVQKSRTLFSNLLKEVQLTAGFHIHFGFIIQIIAPDMPATLNNDKQKEYGLVLSGLVNERQVDNYQNLTDDCCLTMSPIKIPCVRNSFIVSSTDDIDREGEPLKFGQEFTLRAVKTQRDIPLWVSYFPEPVPSSSDRFSVRLSINKDRNCSWKVIALKRQARLETDGRPITNGEKVIVRNCVADRNLCVTYPIWMLTFFGPECGVTVRTYEDIFKRTSAENIFSLQGDKPH